MMGRLPIKESMKPVIEALREGKKRYSDLKDLKVRKYPISETTLNRLLKYLVYWDLVKKEEESGYYVWHEMIFDSEKEYNIAIEHSRRLLETIELMENFYFNPEDLKYFSVKEHLKSYPDIFKSLEKLEEVASQENRDRIQEITESIEDPHKILEKYKYHPHQLIPYLLDMKTQDPIKAKTRADTLTALRPVFKDYFPVYREFAGSISLLKLQVEMGEPLKGKCLSCPKIRIK